MSITVKQEQREALRQLAEKGQALGTSRDQILEASFVLQGHICGGMFRAGVVALKALGIARTENMEHVVFVETGTGHADGCFAMVGAWLVTDKLKREHVKRVIGVVLHRIAAEMVWGLLA